MPDEIKRIIIKIRIHGEMSKCMSKSALNINLSFIFTSIQSEFFADVANIW